MFTQKKLSFKSMLVWTKRDLMFYSIIAVSFTILYELVDIKWLQIPLAPVALIGTAVAFLLGFQNNAAYDRIWEARKIWGGVVNTSRSFIITVRDSFYMENNEAKKDEKDTMKVIAHRHVAWLTAFRFAMRAKKNWESFYGVYSGKSKFNYYVPEFEESLEDELKRHLSKEDFEYVMKIDNKPNAIISLQSMHLRKLNNENKIWSFSLLEMQKMLQELTALQGKSERIKNFPYPKQYESVGFHFVQLFKWLIPLAVIPAFDKMGSDMMAEHPFIGEIFVWLNIPLTVIVIWVFNTMLRVGHAGENPFEGSPQDVPISTISRGITKDILQLVEEEPEKIPTPFERVSGVDM